MHQFFYNLQSIIWRNTKPSWLNILRQCSNVGTIAIAILPKLELPKFEYNATLPFVFQGMVNCLPEECIREILLRLSDSKDVECAGRACLTMNTIAREKRVWRELVQTHFTKQQVRGCSLMMSYKCLTPQYSLTRTILLSSLTLC